MNPQHNESAGMQLPPPVMEQAQERVYAPNQDPQNSPEHGAAAGSERAPSVQAQGGPMAAQPIPIPTNMPQQAQHSSVSNTTNATTQLKADDNDLIEKEWVNKAKQIVESTRDDPYRQSEQLTEVKVDYMKKRYGKTIKLSK